MARLAIDNEMHYVNLTEYVAETKASLRWQKGHLSGLHCKVDWPGFHQCSWSRTVSKFCSDYGVDKAELLEMRVGALGKCDSSALLCVYLEPNWCCNRICKRCRGFAKSCPRTEGFSFRDQNSFDCRSNL